MGRVALEATLAQPFCGQTAVFSEPEKWWRHHCYGACKNSLHVIRQQPPTPRRDEKILFDSFFLVCSLQKFFSLDYTRTKNQSSSFNQRFFFHSVLQSQINTLRKKPHQFYYFPSSCSRDEIASSSASRFFRAIFSHAKLLPPFFHVVVARYPTGREKKPRDDKPLLQRAHTHTHTLRVA